MLSSLKAPTLFYKEQSLDEQIEILSEGTPEAEYELILNPYTHSHIISLIYSTSTTKENLELLKYHPNTPPEYKIPFLDRIKVASYSIKKTDEKILLLLAFDPSIQETLALNQKTPPEILTLLTKISTVHVKEILASHQTNNLTAEGFNNLANDEDENIRALIGFKWDGGDNENIIAKLAADKSELVRSRVACNHFLSKTIIKNLVIDPSPEVRINLSTNNSPYVNFKILSTLAVDANTNVRRTLASEPRLPLHSLILLTKDVDPLTKEIAFEQERVKLLDRTKNIPLLYKPLAYILEKYAQLINKIILPPQEQRTPHVVS